MCGAPEGLVMPGGGSVAGAAAARLLDQPSGIVAGGEGAGGFADFVDGLEDGTLPRSARGAGARITLGPYSHNGRG